MGEHTRDSSLYYALFKESNSIMLILDPNTARIIDCNTTSTVFYGYTSETLCSMSLESLDVGNDARSCRLALRRAHEETQNRFYARHRQSSGIERDVEIHTTPFLWLGRHALFAIIHDISDRRRAERQRDMALKLAQSATRARSEFLASMSHELRTPLNAIIGFSELIKEELLGTVGVPAYRDYATNIFDSGRNLLSLISDILDYADLQTGHAALDTEALNLRTEIDTALASFKPWLEAREHHLTVSVPDTLPRLMADPEGLCQMLSNLISNAIKYTPSPGAIHVSAWADGNAALHISVADTGIGIPEALHEAVFQAFEHTPDSSVRTIQGSGIGLALVQSLMDLHGGRILLDSAPGRGSTFTLVFPHDRSIPPQTGTTSENESRTMEPTSAG